MRRASSGARWRLSCLMCHRGVWLPHLVEEALGDLEPLSLAPGVRTAMPEKNQSWVCVFYPSVLLFPRPETTMKLSLEILKYRSHISNEKC